MKHKHKALGHQLLTLTCLTSFTNITRQSSVGSMQPSCMLGLRSDANIIFTWNEKSYALRSTSWYSGIISWWLQSHWVFYKATWNPLALVLWTLRKQKIGVGQRLIRAWIRPISPMIFIEPCLGRQKSNRTAWPSRSNSLLQGRRPKQ